VPLTPPWGGHVRGRISAPLLLLPLSWWGEVWGTLPLPSPWWGHVGRVVPTLLLLLSARW